MNTRLEKDSIGNKQVPAQAFYGVQSLRAMENFTITGGRMRKEMIESLALLKKACAVAIRKLGGTLGDYSLVHPNDHVNCGQSTNDIVPTAGKMTTLVLLHKLEDALEGLYQSFCRKAQEFDSIIKMGRTQLSTFWKRLCAPLL